VLGQTGVQAKTNENTRLRSLLEPLDPTGLPRCATKNHA
jgi:hypothetical protein